MNKWLKCDGCSGTIENEDEKVFLITVQQKHFVYYKVLSDRASGERHLQFCETCIGSQTIKDVLEGRKRMFQ